MASLLSNQALPWGQRVSAKRQACYYALPASWLLDQKLLESLETPWERCRNNMVELNAFRESGILSERELRITEQYNVAELLGLISSGEITALEATLAFSKRAAIAQQLTNCLTETYFPQAQQRAKQLDLLRENGETVGPLHGLPISLKDTFQIKGSEATIGMVAFLDQASTTNSCLVDILNDLGAVLYCKTNVPQTLMTADSDNNVFGRTLNPWNTALTAGGSSGGEGALIAMRGAAIGVGTDVAGSIRIPALCCGTYGFRPTTGRIPYGKQRGCANPGFRPIPPCAGPLSNDIDSLPIFMKAVLSANPRRYDATATDVPWREIQGSSARKLRLGLVPEDPRIPLHPPVQAALKEAVHLLEKQGHEIVKLSPEECRVDQACQVSWSLLGLDDMPNRRVLEAGETAVPSRLRFQQAISKMGMEHVADIHGLDPLQKYAALTVKRASIADDWNQLWVSKRLDAVVAPAAQNSAVEHDEFNVPAYTVFLNLLDYPACVIPFGKVAGIEVNFKVGSGQSTPQYNPKALEGAPLSIQVFTSSMRDEECLDVAKVVDECLRQGDSHKARF
ncbi:amidase domain protein [Metarhizium robertsii]|uniref:amidase n=2 Tax=Metarhizium robertsii TaxID=568076 RepID=E9F8N6_METRA|nr:general amidase-B [Metarhizium robertsii ARSEF 23]EFY95827.2 general amidase-B [Metarhizium robertsii ARSEF 23]EXU97262.1 amidase domain protein [Metarhizium robertsii]